MLTGTLEMFSRIYVLWIYLATHIFRLFVHTAFIEHKKFITCFYRRYFIVYRCYNVARPPLGFYASHLMYAEYGVTGCHFTPHINFLVHDICSFSLI